MLTQYFIKTDKYNTKIILTLVKINTLHAWLKPRLDKDNRALINLSLVNEMLMKIQETTDMFPYCVGIAKRFTKEVNKNTDKYIEKFQEANTEIVKLLESTYVENIEKIDIPISEKNSYKNNKINLIFFLDLIELQKELAIVQKEIRNKKQTEKVYYTYTE